MSDLHYKIWDTVSMAWTEIGLLDTDYPDIARSIKDLESEWEEVNKVVLYDVCASFAVDSILVLPFWMIMPDWGYDEKYLRKRMQRWGRYPNWVWFLNPLRVVGFPVSLLMSYGVRRRLKRAFIDLS